MDLQAMLDANNGNLTPQDAQALIDAELNGDTDTATLPVTERSEPPATTDAPVTTEQTTEQQATLADINKDNAVILARDGKHTIPFETLEKAREAERKALEVAQLAEQQAQLANTELEKLRQQLSQTNTATQQAKVDNQINIAQQAIENGVDPAIFGDFDEAGLMKGIQTLVEQQVTARVQAQLETQLETKVNERLKQALEPIAQKQQMDEVQSHYSAIMSAHPDVESVAESQEFADWIGKQPSYAQQAIGAVLQQGTAQQVIEVLNDFKATQAPASTVNPTDIKQVAKAKLEQTKPVIPASLSDIAGGQVHTSPDDQLASLNGVDMLTAMEKMTPEQIERFLNKTL